MFNLGHSNIIYNKNNISITDIEFDIYNDFYKSNYGDQLPKNKAIKNLFLIKNTINFLSERNLKLINLIDKDIEREYGGEIFENQTILNIVRFQKIRNKFISEYFQNDFVLSDLEIIISSLKDLKIPISKNNCLTIEKFHNINDDQIFILNLFENLKNNQNNFKTQVGQILYDVCIDNKLFNIFENEIIKYIEDKTQEDFSKLIYGKSN